jgi:hypothetical protein
MWPYKEVENNPLIRRYNESTGLGTQDVVDGITFGLYVYFEFNKTIFSSSLGPIQSATRGIEISLDGSKDFSLLAYREISYHIASLRT